MEVIFEEIRRRRNKKSNNWTEGGHPNGTGDEFFDEASQARYDLLLNIGRNSLTWTHIVASQVSKAFSQKAPNKLRSELVQLLTILVAWVDDIDTKEREAKKKIGET